MVKLDFFLILFMLLAFGGALIMAKDWPLGPSLFPLVIGAIGVSMAIRALITLLTKGNGGAPRGSGRVFVKRELTTFGWILGFFGISVLLGFQWGLPGITLLYLKFEGRVKSGLSILLSAICWGFLYAMRSLLHLPLPEGFIGWP